ncbi:MAG TPA: hypothetical protein ENG78_03855 [Acidiferrobacteraceae bacterium]|nr:hypothetical protein [Acidiferrobacteraceae bacterium]HEX19936.1 hypothetical protein [Acidiferrobacteraceae bacterium]
MFKNKTNTHLLMLAFSGLAMITMAIYFQITSVDLEKYSLAEYLQNDVKLVEWWQIVVLPLFVGSIFVAVSIVGFKYRNIRKILFFTLAISVLTLPFHVFSGVIGLLTSITCLVNEFKSKHNKPLQPTQKPRG